MYIRHLGLLLPAVLAGCVSQSANNDGPATVYVEGLIANSAQTIGHAQSSLHQSGPDPVRPVSPVNKVASLPSSQVHSATAASALQAPTLSHVIYTGRPGPMPFPQRAGYARHITVEAAAQRIIPPGWSLNWSPAVKKVRRQRINMSMNDQWPRVLNNLMSSRSLYATVEWGMSRVTITPQNPRSPGLTTK